MSVSRISVVKFKTKEACDEMVESYTSNAPNEFPEAEQLLHIRIDDNTSIAVSPVSYTHLTLPTICSV